MGTAGAAQPGTAGSIGAGQPGAANGAGAQQPGMGAGGAETPRAGGAVGGGYTGRANSQIGNTGYNIGDGHGSWDWLGLLGLFGLLGLRNRGHGPTVAASGETEYETGTGRIL